MKKGKSRKSSKFHIKAYELIRQIFPTEQIIEEISIPLTRKKIVYGDIYIPRLRKLVEVHGEQHYKFIPHFHQTKANFRKGQTRDREKKEWCTINEIEYIELPYDKTDEWETRLNE